MLSDVATIGVCLQGGLVGVTYLLCNIAEGGGGGGGGAYCKRPPLMLSDVATIGVCLRGGLVGVTYLLCNIAEGGGGGGGGWAYCKRPPLMRLDEQGICSNSFHDSVADQNWFDSRLMSFPCIDEHQGLLYGDLTEAYWPVTPSDGYPIKTLTLTSLTLSCLEFKLTDVVRTSHAIENNFEMKQNLQNILRRVVDRLLMNNFPKILLLREIYHQNS